MELCLGTDLGWDTCGPCFTLCPHWGSGWARGRQGAERGVLNLNIQKTKIMSSSPITLWQIDGETVETVSDFILGGSKMTACGDGSHDIRRCLLIGRKFMTNLDSIFKSRDITLPTKGLSSQGYCFSCGHVWM